MSGFSQFLKEETIEVTDAHKPAVIAPGRMNPPHRGHKLVIDELIKLGNKLKATPIIVVIDSGKYGAKNPLTGEVREKYIKKMFPGIRVVIAHNPYEAVAQLADPEHSDENFFPVGGVTGSDRADSYKKMVGRIFGPEIEKQYQAKVIARDPDATEGVAGVSATKVRSAAIAGDVGEFRAMTGLRGKDADDLMKLVKKGMES